MRRTLLASKEPVVPAWDDNPTRRMVECELVAQWLHPTGELHGEELLTGGPVQR